MMKKDLDVVVPSMPTSDIFKFRFRFKFRSLSKIKDLELIYRRIIMTSYWATLHGMMRRRLRTKLQRLIVNPSSEITEIRTKRHEKSRNNLCWRIFQVGTYSWLSRNHIHGFLGRRTHSPDYKCWKVLRNTIEA